MLKLYIVEHSFFLCCKKIGEINLFFHFLAFCGDRSVSYSRHEYTSGQFRFFRAADDKIIIYIISFRIVLFRTRSLVFTSTYICFLMLVVFFFFLVSLLSIAAAHFLRYRILTVIQITIAYLSIIFQRCLKVSVIIAILFYIRKVLYTDVLSFPPLLYNHKPTPQRDGIEQLNQIKLGLPILGCMISCPLPCLFNANTIEN